MVPLTATDEGQVDSLQPGPPPDREVGVVGHPAIDLDERRTGRRGRQTGRHGVDHRGVAASGLEPIARPLRAASLEVHHRADLAEPRMRQEALGAEQVGLLAVVDQQHHVAPQRWRSLEGAGDLEHRGDRGAGVGRAGASRHRVVVGRYQHRAAPPVAVVPRQHVLHRGADRRRTAGEDLLHLGGEAQSGEFVDHPLAHRVVRRRTDRMRCRPGQQPLVDLASASSGELGRGCIRRFRFGGLIGVPGDDERQHQGGDRREPARGRRGGRGRFGHRGILRPAGRFQVRPRAGMPRPRADFAIRPGRADFDR